MKREGKSVFKKPENAVEENWIRPSKVFCGLKMHVLYEIMDDEFPERLKTSDFYL